MWNVESKTQDEQNANEQRFEQLSKGCLSAAVTESWDASLAASFAVTESETGLSRVALGLARVRERSGIGVSA